MQVKEVCLKNKFSLYILFFSLIFFYKTISANGEEEYYKSKVIEYLSEINEFSSSFIQHDGNSYQEGEFFLKKNRLKIRYTFPTNIVLVVKESNAMYFNVDLSEAQYFNPNNTAAEIFFDFFYNQKFLDKAEFFLENNSFSFVKTMTLNNETSNVKIFFEESPIKLRKIEIVNSQGKISFTIINPDYNPDLDDEIFSLANPLLN